MPTRTPKQKVSYSDSNVDTTIYANSNWDGSRESVAEIVDTMVNSLYSLNGNSGSCMQILFTEDKQKIMDAADALAELRGIEKVEVEEFYRFHDGTVYKLHVRAVTSFRYFYALDTGDTSKLTVEDEQAIAEIRRLVEIAKQYGSDYEKEKYFHDYLVSNISYNDGDAAGTGQTPYGALVLKKCVCNGYASSFELLLSLSGIPCTFVSGRGNGGDHAWNQVLLGGAWYNVDVTWDDPVPDGGSRVLYTYFNVNDEFFSQSHVANTDYKIKCFATEYNGTKKMYHECKSQEEANQYAKNIVDSGTNYVEFLYTGDTEFDMDSMIHAVNRGVRYYTDHTSVGTVYRITFT